jgi:hypothetical protein
MFCKDRERKQTIDFVIKTVGSSGIKKKKQGLNLLLMMIVATLNKKLEINLPKF